MKHYMLASLLALTALTGCAKPTEEAASAQQAVPSELAASVDGIKSEATPVAQATSAKPEYPTPPEIDPATFEQFLMADNSTLPKDGPQFYADVKNINDLMTPPYKGHKYLVGLYRKDANGQLMLNATCERNRTETICTTQDGKAYVAYEELSKPGALPLVRNAMVLSKDYDCSSRSVCYTNDDAGHLMGRISDEALEWMSGNGIGM